MDSNNTSDRTLFIFKHASEMGLNQIFELNYSYSDRKQRQDMISDPASFGVSKDVIHLLVQTDVNIESVFCHPNRLLIEQSSVLYFRSINCISQKAFKSSKLKDCVPFEKGIRKLDAKTAEQYALFFNQNMNHLIEKFGVDIVFQNIRPTFYMSIGTQIDGMWRNRIGSDAEIAFFKSFVEVLVEKGLLINEPKKRTKEVVLLNDLVVRCASEPDVAIYKEHELIFVIEIKGGSDKAGALERFGAAKKSFQRAKQQNPNCRTALVTKIITCEMAKLMEMDADFSYVFDLDRLVTDKYYMVQLIEIIMNENSTDSYPKSA